MKIKKPFKVIILSLVIAGLVGVGVVFYLFNQPHRDIQSTKTDYSFEASKIVNEYLQDPNLANEKYLDEEGDSKVLEITGVVSSIDEDYNSNKVILLKKDSDKAGVSCTLLDKKIDGVAIGAEIRIKGVIRSGATYDSDMDLYENVIMEDCKIIK